MKMCAHTNNKPVDEARTLDLPPRKIYSLLGFPCDDVNIGGAIEIIDRAIDNKQSCFISTPNLNWITSATRSSAIRESVCQSDLSLIDGVPLIWISKLLGLPFSTRVPGSTLFEALKDRPRADEPIKVFFFGGASNASELAMLEINRERSGVYCVGACNPGMGSVDELSTPRFLEQINTSDADMVIVALGAHKGQLWIQKNRHLISAPVITHLGAVVNFAAGTIQRAPKLLQSLGLEWAWRIKEEPYLWRRYAGDAIGLAKLLVTQVAPLSAMSAYSKLFKSKNKLLSITPTIKPSGTTLILSGQATENAVIQFLENCQSLEQQKLSFTLDCSSLSFIDSAFMAQIQLLQASGTITECIVDRSGLVGRTLTLNRIC